MNDPFWQNLGRPLPTPKEMAAWDASSVADFYIPETMLMENASREAFHVLNNLLEPERRILILIGGGNNGGDGACLARHLHDAGHNVLVCCAKPPETMSTTAQEHLRIARKTGTPFAPLSFSEGLLSAPPEFQRIARAPHVVVDALLGTGFSGVLREKEREIIRFINQMSETATIIALDVPSGLDGLTGRPRPEAVRAAHTITFEAAKTGLAFPSAREYCGRLHIRRIGVPSVVREQIPPSFRLLEPFPTAWPNAKTEMHKGDAGKVLVVGGSKGLTGAPALAALGALRAGAGLVSIACPGALEPLIRNGFPEIMTEHLGDAAAWSAALLPECAKILCELPRASAVVLGPGLGRTIEAMEFATALLEEKNRPPLVLDADGLFPLAAIKNGADPVLSPLLTLLREEDCITPHPGEAARILGATTQDVQADRAEALRALVDATAATVVLKGAGTLVGRRGAPIFIAPFATPSLAVGGSGDVLSGVIAAFATKVRVSPSSAAGDAFRAACLGVYLHGKAGEQLDKTHPNRGALARDIANELPRVAPERHALTS